MSDRSGALPGIPDAPHRPRRLTERQHEALSRPARRHCPVDATERRCQMARLRARPHAKFDIMARSSPGKWPNRRHLMSTHRPARTTAQRRAHRRPKPTVERLSRAARSSVTVPCSSTATLQDAWWSFMMALQPADAPAPAVCSLVALEGHDDRGGRYAALLHTLDWDALRASRRNFQISRRAKGQFLRLFATLPESRKLTRLRRVTCPRVCHGTARHADRFLESD